ncbi:MAG: hypothetical protein CVV64_09155 [Candidatus Wallbacteria bacterium HGW-Wallbacteria-1]|uniref:Peptidase MA-like domain-containing protein n=1 Tax=Candidatus Wallbacteria bacterium HGW-Wallbacteria-1 TaxID=2013854 RepID=A0A2N1PQA5_9BACT|nr:MAG: hypothetical protein CVV64_09155 [Candidatus Wallbacteria bacterium HGW-Wallbacteria-1]
MFLTRISVILTLTLIMLLPGFSHAQEVMELMKTAQNLMSAENYSEARVSLLEASNLEPDRADVRGALSTMLNNCGVKLLSADRAQEGLELCRKAVELEPENVRLILNTGSACEKVGQYDEAFTLYQDALSLQEKDGSEMRDTLMMLGILKYKTKEHYDAIFNFEQVIQKDSSDSAAWFYKGLAEYDSGQMEAAISSLESAREKASDDESRKNILSWLQKIRSEHKVEGSFVQDQTNHFIIKFDMEKRADVVGRILENCEDAYSEIGDRMDFYPPVQTTVVIYDPGQFYSLGKPQWSAGVYDNGMIRLPINDARANAQRLKQVIFHEYTHLVVNYLAKGRHVPQWLNEGLADHNSDDPPGFRELAIFSKSLVRGAVNLGDLEGSFSGITDRSTVSLVYTTSYMGVKFLIELIGYDEILSMLRSFGQGYSTAEVFSEVVRMDIERFQKAFADWLIENYR